MKTNLPLTLLIFFAFFKVSFAQKRDTSADQQKIDIGKLSIDKDALQGITVKAKDLEKFPAQNLEEALNVWFFGNYLPSEKMIYMVDGNILNDINIYSIEDIEEATLVQNALATLNGLRNQKLIVITTKKSAKTKEIHFLSQSALVNSKAIYSFYDPAYQYSKRTKNAYYYHSIIGISDTKKDFDYRLSADYSRDVFPSLTASKINTSPNLDRIKFNTFFHKKLGKYNQISFNINYTPQFFNVNQNDVRLGLGGGSIQKFNSNYNSNVLSTNLSLESKLGSSFKNNLSLLYKNMHDQQNINFGFSSGTSGNSQINKNNYQTSSYRIKDELVGHFDLAGISLDPALGVLIKRNKFSSNFYARAFSGSNNYYESQNHQNSDDLNLSLTPNISIYKEHIFYLNTGLSIDKYGNSFYGSTSFNQTFLNPFASISYDISNLWDKQNHLGIKLYASYAESNTQLFQNLPQFNYLTSLPNILNITSDHYSTNFNSQIDPSVPIYFNITNLSADHSKKTKTFQSGVSIPILKKYLTINYTYSYIEGNAWLYFLEATSQGFQYYAQPNSLILNNQYVSFKYQKKLTNSFSVVSQLAFNYSETINKNTFSASKRNFYNWDNQFDTYHLGFANRVSVKNYHFEVDLIAHFKQSISYFDDYRRINYENYNSFNIQNLGIGYSLKTLKLKSAEVFLSGRNLIQNQKSNLYDGRRFYTLGIKGSL